MDKYKMWTPQYGFNMLNLFQNTDEELKILGMTPDDIIHFREYGKMHTSSLDSEKQNNQEAELFEGDNNTDNNFLDYIDITKTRIRKDALPTNNWSEGIVDREKEHLNLFFQEQEDPKAIVNQTKEKGIVVQFLTSEPEDQTAKEEVTRDLNFYFNELNKEYPWEYAIYHVNSASNSYSDVHWCYYPVGWQPR